MTNRILKQVEEAHLKKDIPQFVRGDTVDVATRIIEGDKERIQIFSGTVIARKGSGINTMFTVRRIVNNEGVERTFPLNSPKVAGIEVLRGGQARRAKLYFLRDRVGKATRLKDVKTGATAAQKAATATHAAAPAAAEPAKA